MEKKAYYTNHANLSLQIDQGEEVVVNGRAERINVRIIEFTPVGQTGYGRTYVDNEKDAVRLDALVAKGHLMTEEQYNATIIPPNVRMAQIEAENKRLLQETNRLMAEMAKRSGQQQQSRA